MRCTTTTTSQWREEHFGRTFWVIRKGCTPARPGQEGFVGGSMGNESVILQGVKSSEAEESLFSTVHGAGRVMSRTQAAGKVRRRKRWACAHRDCDRVFAIDGSSSHAGAGSGPPAVCPEHPDSRPQKVWIQEQIKPGKVDWPAVQARLREQGIVLVGGGADEAPEVLSPIIGWLGTAVTGSDTSTNSLFGPYRWRRRWGWPAARAMSSAR